MEQLQLKDPLKSRVISNIPKPFQKSLPSDMIFKDDIVNWRTLKDFLKKQGKISNKDFMKLIKKASHILSSQPNLLKAEDPITVVGDIHGQYYDLLKILDELGGDPDNQKYLFLGDYVDRGNFSCEVVILLLALKISRPKQILLLRGNHQARMQAQRYGFRSQCNPVIDVGLQKYNQEIYDCIMGLFDQLPLACIVNGTFFCVHGGISHLIYDLADINKANRVKQIPVQGFICDFMWSDPTPNQNGKCGKLVQQNNSRNVSFYYGSELVNQFFSHNNLKCIVRAHEVQNQGFKSHNWGATNSVPMVLTVFSAPNYCDFYKNKGAILKIKNKQLRVKAFNYSPHPYFLPKNVDLWNYILPILAETASQVLDKIIKPQIKQFQKLDQQQMKKLYKKAQSLKHQCQQCEKLAKQQIEENNKYVGGFENYAPDAMLFEVMDVRKGFNMPFEEKKKIDGVNQSLRRQKLSKSDKL